MADESLFDKLSTTTPQEIISGGSTPTPPSNKSFAQLSAQGAPEWLSLAGPTNISSNTEDYGFNTYFDQDNEEIRAINQATSDKIANGLAKAAVITGTSIVENTAGVVAGMVQGLTNVAQGEGASGFVEGMYNNPVGEVVDGINKWMQKAMPNYYSKAEQENSFLESLGTANFWADKFLSGAGYFAGAYLTGLIGTKALFNAAKTANAANPAMVGLSEDLAALPKGLEATAKASQITTRAKQLAIGVAMAHGESSVEARGIYDSIKENLTAKRDEGDPNFIGLTDEEIDAQAKAGANVGYGYNMAVVGGTNALQFGKMIMSKSALKNELLKENAVKGVESKAFGELALKKSSKWLERGKRGALGFAEEGGQELAQLGIEKNANEFALSQYDPTLNETMDQSIFSVVDQMAKNLGTKEGLESIFLGGLLGGPGQILGGRGQRATERKNSQEFVDLFNKNFATINNYRENMLQASSSNALAEEALRNNDDFNYYNEAHNAFKAFVKATEEKGGTDILIKQLEMLKELDNEEYMKFVYGNEQNSNTIISPETDKVNKSKKLVDYVKKQVEIHRELSSKYPGVSKPVFDSIYDAVTNFDNIDEREKELSQQVFDLSDGMISYGASRELAKDLGYKDQEHRAELDAQFKKAYEVIKAKNPETAKKLREKYIDLNKLADRREDYINKYNEAINKPNNINVRAEALKRNLGIIKDAENEMVADFFAKNTNEDENFGFDSNVITVETPVEKPGEIITYEDYKTGETKTLDTSEYDEVKTVPAKEGPAFLHFMKGGKKVMQIREDNIKSRTEGKSTKQSKLRLTKDPNIMVDENGVEYNTLNILKSGKILNVKSYQEDRIIAATLARIISLEKMINTQEKALNIVQKEISETEELLKEVSKEIEGYVLLESGLVRAPNGRMMAYQRAEELETKLNSLKQARDRMSSNISDLNENIDAMYVSLDSLDKQAINGEKFIKETTATINGLKKNIEWAKKQIEDGNKIITELDEKINLLQKVLDVLGVQIKYTKGRDLTQDMFNEYSATANELQQLKDVKAELAKDIDSYVKESSAQERLLNRLQTELDSFKEELKVMNDYRNNTVKKVIVAEKKAKNEIKGDVEIVETPDNAFKVFDPSAKKSIKDVGFFATTGKDEKDSSEHNQRWYAFMENNRPGKNGWWNLRLFNSPENPDDIKAVLYIDGSPVDIDGKPIMEDEIDDKGIYNYIPLPTTSTGSEFGDRFYDLQDFDEAEIQAYIDDYKTFREEVKIRLASDEPVYVSTNGKSFGIPQTVKGERYSVEESLSNDNPEDFKNVKIVLPDEVVEEDGVKKQSLTIAGKKIIAPAGVMFVADENGNSVPLLSRKLDTEETNLVFKLIEAYANIAVTGKKIKGRTASVVKVSAKSLGLKGKGTFILYKNGNKLRYKRNKKGAQFKDVSPKFKAKALKAYVDNETKAKTFDRKADTNSKASRLLNAITGIIYYNAEGNSDFRIGHKDGKFHFGETVIPLTVEDLQKNEVEIKALLANKFHHSSFKKLKSTDKYYTYKLNADGKLVSSETYDSYKDYLINAKTPSGENRNIPFTTNITKELRKFKGIYLKFHENIMDKPGSKPTPKKSNVNIVNEPIAEDTEGPDVSNEDGPDLSAFEDALGDFDPADLAGASNSAAAMSALFGGKNDKADDPFEAKKEPDDTVKENDEDDVDLEPPFRTKDTGGERINYEKAKAWLESKFPGVSVDKVLGLIDGVGFGVTKGYATTLSLQAEEGTEYHEAFHIGIRNFLSNSELTKLFNEAKKVFKKPSKKDIAELKTIYPGITSSEELEELYYEEELAESFRDYVMSKEKVAPTGLKGFFSKLLNYVKSILGIESNDTIRNLFESIASGELGARPRVVNRFDRKNNVFAAIPGTTVEFTHNLMQGITAQLFDALIRGNIKDSNGKTIDNYKDFLDLNPKEFTPIYKSLLGLDETKASSKNVIGLLINKKNQYAKVNDAKRVSQKEAEIDLVRNHPKLVTDHFANFIKTLGIDMRVTGETLNKVAKTQEELLDNVEDDEKVSPDTYSDSLRSVTISAKDSATAFVKLMIASLPKIDEAGKYDLSSDGMLQLVDFNRVFTKLSNATAGTFTKEAIFDIIKKESFRNKSLKGLLAMLEKNPNDNEKYILRNQFLQAFGKIKMNYKFYLLDEANVYPIDPNNNKLLDKVKTNWLSAFRVSNYVKKYKNRDTLDSTAINKLFNKYKTLKESDDRVVGALQILNAFGLEAKVDDVRTLDQEVLDTFLGSFGQFMTAITKQDQPITEAFKNFSGDINNIIDIVSSVSDEASENTHLGPDGEPRYDIIQHNYMSIITSVINKLPVKKARKLLKDELPFLFNVYTGNSELLKLDGILFDKDGDLRRNALGKRVNFEIGILEGAKIDTSGEQGEVSHEMTLPDKLWQSFDSTLRGTYEYTRPSDKSLFYSFSFPIDVNFNNINEKNAAWVNTLYGYVQDEVKRHNLLTEKGVGENIQYYNKSNRLVLFDFITDPNNKEKSIAEIKKFINDQKDNTLKLLEDNNVITKKQNGNYSTSVISKDVLDMFNVKNSKDIPSDVMSDILGVFTVKDMISKVEFTKVFTGDPAFYKTFGDYIKRVPGGVGTKDFASTGTEDTEFFETLDRTAPRYDKKTQDREKIKSIVWQDVNSVSEYLQSYKDILVESGEYTPSEANDIINEAYEAMDEADAQGYITMDEYRDFMIRVGKWNFKIDESLYHKIQRGEKITQKEIKHVFNSIKAQYFGPQSTDTSVPENERLNIPTYYKFSLMPIIPQVAKGTKMEVMLKSMMANQVGIGVFGSGNKVGGVLQLNDNNTYELQPFYDKNGNIVPVNKDLTYTTIDYKWLGVQVEIAPKVKTELPFGTQMRKLIISNMFKFGKAVNMKFYNPINQLEVAGLTTEKIYQEYTDTIDKLTDIASKELLSELGSTIKDNKNGTYTFTDLTKLVDILKSEAVGRSAPDNLVDSISAITNADKTVRLAYPLDSLPNRNKIENILMSLINNRVIRQKMYGSGKIQGANTGYEALSTQRTFDNKGKIKGSSDLKMYRESSKGGPMLRMEVKLAAPKEWMPWIESLGGLAKFNKLIKDGSPLIDKRLLNIIGYRIPTQGMNSIDAIRIAEFLDPIAGEIIMLPSEIVAKSGTDYDIDKMNIFLPNFVKDGTNILYQDNQSTTEGMKNRLIELMSMIVTSPQNAVQLIKPNTTKTLKDLAKEIQKLEARDDGAKAKVWSNLLSWSYMQTLGNQYLVGKRLVGSAALQATGHINSQIAGLEINDTYVIKGQTKSTKLNFKGYSNTKSMALQKDLNNLNFVSDILSEFVNAAVDIAKEPFIFFLNCNPYTFDTMSYLLRRGIPIDTVAYFVNQPIVKELIDARNSSKSMVAKVSGNEKFDSDIVEALLTKYKSTEPNPVSYDNKILKNAIDVTSDKGEKFKNLQTQVLSDYLNYEEQAKLMAELQRATTQDTKTPKNINAALLYDSLLDQVYRSKFFTKESIDKYVDGTILKSFKKAQKIGISLYNELFTIHNPIVKQYIDPIRNMVNNLEVSQDDRIRIMDKMNNDFITSIYSSLGKTNKGKPINSKIRETMVRDSNTLAQRIAKYFASGAGATKIKNDPLFAELFPIVGNERSLVDNVKFFSRKLNKYESDRLTESFYNLYINTKEGTDAKRIMEDLVYLGMLQSGLNNSPITFLDKIPYKIYGDIVKKAIEEFEMLSGTEQESFIQNFIDQFFRNNTDDSVVVPKVPQKNKAGKYVTVSYLSKKAKYAYIKVWKPSVNPKAKEEGLPLGEWELYRATGVYDNKKANTDAHRQYERIGKLGNGLNLKEYYQTVQKSQLEENNFEETPVLPKTNIFEEGASTNNIVEEKIDLNPTNISEENREKYKKYVLDKIGKINKIKSIEKGYEVIFENGEKTELFPKQGQFSNLSKYTKEDGADIKIFAGISKLIEEEINNIKPGVSELFEANPELANSVYEALGFKGEKIIETAKGSTYRYLPSGKTQRFKKVEGKEYEPQDILTFVPNYEWIKSNNPQWLEKQGLENDTQYTQYLLEKVQGKDKVWIVDSKGKKIETNQDAKTADRLFIAFGKKDGTVEDFIPVSKEPVIGFYTYDSRIHFDEKGERYRNRHLGNKVVKITEGITPQQKQQAQQLYSQYLDTIFPDSKVKDIVYHGTSNLEKVKSEGFNKSKLKTGEGTNLQGSGFYFAKFKQVLSNYAKGEKGGFIQAIVNLKNPLQERNFPEFLKRQLNEENVSFGNVIEVGEKVDNWLSNNNKDGVIWNQISSFKEGTAEQETAREKLFGTAYNKNQKTLDVEHYSVKEPEQIHILGSKQDVEGFKEFTSKNSVSLTFNTLDIEVQKRLIKNGMTKEVFDNAIQEDRDNWIKCYGK